jgi:hypothetical protein
VGSVQQLQEQKAFCDGLSSVGHQLILAFLMAQFLDMDRRVAGSIKRGHGSAGRNPKSPSTQDVPNKDESPRCVRLPLPKAFPSK